MTRKIAITTPTGNNGRALTARLLDVAKEKQLEIVLLARDPGKVRAFTERGARVEKGSVDDAAFVARATESVDALFWLTPQNFEPGEENGAFVPRLIMPYALSYDHRVIDGVAAAKFTQFLSTILTDIRHILL